MLKDDCFTLGHISRRHGLKGALVAVFDTDQPENYTNLESVFLEKENELVPFFISALTQNSKGHFILHFEDVTEDEAESLIGKELFLPLNELPQLTGNSFYFHEVIGFEVIDQEHGTIGKVVGFLDNTAQVLFKIEHEKAEILLPAIDEIIQKVDRENKKLYVAAPEGLIEMYLG